MFTNIPQFIFSFFKKLFRSRWKSIANAPQFDITKGVKNLETDLPSSVFSVPISKNKIQTYPDVETIIIKVQFLGKLRIEINDKPLILNGKNGLVLASLLLDYPREIHKENLMQRFWTDSLSAKNSLNVAICNIRKALKDLQIEKEIIVFEANLYSICPNSVIITDVETFKKVRREAMDIMRRQGLTVAIEHFEKLIWLYNGDFLENYPNDTWALGERDSYFEYYFEALRLLSEHYEKTGNIERCIDYCRQMLRHDPHFEPIHRRLIQSFQRLGAKDKAIRQYQECAKALKLINASPSKETQELFKELA